MVDSESTPEQQNRLGVAYATGERDGKIDNALALKWYLRSASAGYAEALWNAGSMLVDGEEGVQADPGLGMLLIRLAAEVHQTSACLYLARCHETGRGVPLNPDLAKQWTLMAYQIEKASITTSSPELQLIACQATAKKYMNLPDKAA